MTQTRFFPTLFLGWFLLGACSAEVAGRKPKADSVGVPELSVDGNVEEQSIREVAQQWEKAVQARDADAAVSFYAEDAILIPQDSEPVEGRDVLRARFARFFENPTISVNFEPTTIAVARKGDVAYEVGTFQIQVNQVEETGHYITVWRKVRGDWKRAFETGRHN